ncbi:MAG: signal peptidase I [Candidatus Zixiibacteriota bacterium]|nr:MAG: signal peptidase I [candidate division Zixibacteria bacterium]
MFRKQKKQVKKKEKKSALTVVREYVESFAIALIFALIVKCSVVEAYKIPSGSMEDTLLVGDFLLANKFIYGSKVPLLPVHLPAFREPKPGDIVIFKYPLNPKVNYIKRCVAVEGQTVEIKNKVLYIDGKRVDDPGLAKYTDPNTRSPGRDVRDNYGPAKVPKGHLFMMGDNRDNSADSRFWGFLPRELVLGKAMIIHWSWAPDPKAPAVSSRDILSVPHNVGYNILHLPQRVRWGRLLSTID